MLWEPHRPGLGCRLPTVPQRQSEEKAPRVACVQERVDCGTGTCAERGKGSSCAVPTLRDTPEPSQHHPALPELGGTLGPMLCWSRCVCACACGGAGATECGVPRLCCPDRTEKARVPHCRVLAAVSPRACAGRRAGRSKARRSVGVSQSAWGRCVGAEGHGVHQNMCAPAARREGLEGEEEKCVPFPVPAILPPPRPQPQHPTLGLWPLHRIGSPTLALTQPLPMAWG